MRGWAPACARWRAQVEAVGLAPTPTTGKF
nr:MAG TPA: hypothetical protein [Caudoviricetes sp.]